MKKLAFNKDGQTYMFDKDELHTKDGIIKAKKTGLHITTNTGQEFSVVKPGLVDFWNKKKRGPQAFTLKDIGLVLTHTGVSNGWKVLEAGCGTGSLSLFLASAVSPNGKLYAVDNRKNHLDITKENITKAGLSENVSFAEYDVHEKIKVKNLDLVVLDMAEPWNAFENVEKALKQGGHLVTFVPSYEQLKETYKKLESLSFSNPTTLECTTREVVVKERGTRPVSTGLTHTGFLTFTRKY